MQQALTFWSEPRQQSDNYGRNDGDFGGSSSPTSRLSAMSSIDLSISISALEDGVVYKHALLIAGPLEAIESHDCGRPMCTAFPALCSCSCSVVGAKGVGALQ